MPLYGRVGLVSFFLRIYFVLFPLPMVGKVSQLNTSSQLASFPESEKVKVKLLSRVQFFVTPWTVAHQAPLSMGFSQEYWRGLPFPLPGVLPDPGLEPGSPALQADALPSEPPGKPKQVYSQCK